MYCMSVWMWFSVGLVGITYCMSIEIGVMIFVVFCVCGVAVVNMVCS